MACWNEPRTMTIVKKKKRNTHKLLKCINVKIRRGRRLEPENGALATFFNYPRNYKPARFIHKANGGDTY